MTTGTVTERGHRAAFETLTPSQGVPRFPVLDGWRGISILLVVAAHLFPLGPKSWAVNVSVAALGMAIFFTLSGFLITTTLLHRPRVGEFLIRRLCRIVPLAWLFSLLVLGVLQAPAKVFAAHLLFFGNLPPFLLTEYTSHLWSLCVEVQFYATIALLCALLGRRGLWAIPALCLLITAHRIVEHSLISIVTTLRADEILAGGILAMVRYHERARPVGSALARVHPLLWAALAAAASNELAGPVGYLRPYLVAAMVGSTLFVEPVTPLTRLLRTTQLAYVAAISYALYVLHPMVGWGWLGEGATPVKYAKRLPALAAVIGLAHLSTFYFEHWWIGAGKRWSKRLSSRGDAQPAHRPSPT